MNFGRKDEKFCCECNILHPGCDLIDIEQKN